MLEITAIRDESGEISPVSRVNPIAFGKIYRRGERPLDRLPSWEQESLGWLAIPRVSPPAERLAASLARPISRQKLLEAIVPPERQGGLEKRDHRHSREAIGAGFLTREPLESV